MRNNLTVLAMVSWSFFPLQLPLTPGRGWISDARPQLYADKRESLLATAASVRYYKHHALLFPYLGHTPQIAIFPQTAAPQRCICCPFYGWPPLHRFHPSYITLPHRAGFLFTDPYEVCSLVIANQFLNPLHATRLLFGEMQISWSIFWRLFPTSRSAIYGLFCAKNM